MALDKQIEHLEQQFQQLQGIIEQLSSENTVLRQTCAQLQQKNEKASQHVESAITRLKAQQAEPQ